MNDMLTLGETTDHDTFAGDTAIDLIANQSVDYMDASAHVHIYIQPPHHLQYILEVIEESMPFSSWFWAIERSKPLKSNHPISRYHLLSHHHPSLKRTYPFHA